MNGSLRIILEDYGHQHHVRDIVIGKRVNDAVAIMGFTALWGLGLVGL